MKYNVFILATLLMSVTACSSAEDPETLAKRQGAYDSAKKSVIIAQESVLSSQVGTVNTVLINEAWLAIQQAKWLGAATIKLENQLIEIQLESLQVDQQK